MIKIGNHVINTNLVLYVDLDKSDFDLDGKEVEGVCIYFSTTANGVNEESLFFTGENAKILRQYFENVSVPLFAVKELNRSEVLWQIEQELDRFNLTKNPKKKQIVDRLILDRYGSDKKGISLLTDDELIDLLDFLKSQEPEEKEVFEPYATLADPANQKWQDNFGAWHNFPMPKYSDFNPYKIKQS